MGEWRRWRSSRWEGDKPPFPRATTWTSRAASKGASRSLLKNACPFPSPLPPFFQSFLDDFTGHNVDVACCLLESAGRFLVRSPETSVRMGLMLDVFCRLKEAKNLPLQQAALAENAYVACRPPERAAVRRKERPPLHDYIR